MTKILKEQMTAGLLEEGFYTLKVESAEYGVSSDGKSKRAIVNFSVVGTEYEGYEIKSVFSLDNPSNQKSERIRDCTMNCVRKKYTGGKHNERGKTGKTKD